MLFSLQFEQDWLQPLQVLFAVITNPLRHMVHTPVVPQVRQFLLQAVQEPLTRDFPGIQLRQFVALVVQVTQLASQGEQLLLPVR